MIRVGKETKKYREYLNKPNVGDWADSLANTFKFLGFKTRRELIVAKEEKRREEQERKKHAALLANRIATATAVELEFQRTGGKGGPLAAAAQ